MLRIAGRFVLDWNPTRQDVTQAHQNGLFEFIVPYVAQAFRESEVAKIGAAPASPLHHVDLSTAVDAVSNVHVIPLADAPHAERAAIDVLTFADTFAGAPSHAAYESHTLVGPSMSIHEMLTGHPDSLIYLPSMMQSPVLHPVLAHLT